MKKKSEQKKDEFTLLQETINKEFLKIMQDYQNPTYYTYQYDIWSYLKLSHKEKQEIKLQKQKVLQEQIKTLSYLQDLINKEKYETPTLWKKTKDIIRKILKYLNINITWPDGD